MDFDLTDEQKLLQQTIRDFAKTEIAPGAADRDEKMSFPHELIPKMAVMKLLGIAIPEKLGGAGLGAMETVIVLEEIGRVDGAMALIVACIIPSAPCIFIALGRRRSGRGMSSRWRKGRNWGLGP